MTNKLSTSLLLFLLLLCSGSLVAQNAKAPIPYVETLVVCDRADWNFRVGEEAMVRLQAYAGGIPLNRVEVSYEAGNELMAADMKRSLMLMNGQAEIRFGTMNQPGFRSCKMTFEVDGKSYTKQVKVGFSPEAITPTVAMPADFKRFWQDALVAAQTPMNAESSYREEMSTETVDVYLTKLTCPTQGHSIYGYLSLPKGEGKHPVVLVPPGAGVKTINPLYDYAEQGFITLAIEVHGVHPEADKQMLDSIKRTIGDYHYTGIDQASDYYYKRVYLNCVRAVDWLCTLPRFDGVNVGTTGGSQGGALSIVTAALNKRVTFVSAFYPALSDMTGFLYNRAGGWPKYFDPSNRKELPVDEKRMVRTLAYYDVVNFARTLTIPGFYSYGYNDNTTPPTSVAAVINSITASKTVVITPTSAHWRFPETNEKANAWIKGRWTMDN